MLQSYLLHSHALLAELPKVRCLDPGTIIHRLVQNASPCAKSFLELAPPIHSPTHFTDTLDSMPECHFRF